MRRQTGSIPSIPSTLSVPAPQTAAEAFEMIELATADLSTLTRAFDVLAEFVKLPAIEIEEKSPTLQ